MSYKKEPITFQLIEFYTENMFEKIFDDDNYDKNSDGDSSDEESDDSADDETRYNDNQYNKNSASYSKEYKIYLFGRTAENKTVSVLVNKFTPFYYIRVPDAWNDTQCQNLVNWTLAQLDKKQISGFVRWRVDLKKSFKEFSNNHNYKFIRMVFNNTTTMNRTIDVFVGKRGEQDNEIKFFKTYCGKDFKRYPLGIPDDEEVEFQLYESNIDPLLRFLHIQNLEPTGWITINDYETNIPKATTSNIDISCNWTAVKRYTSTLNMGFSICSFDIETDSSHGDFPLAKKDYLKVARDLVEYWNNINKKIEEFKKESKKLDEEKNKLYLEYLDKKKNAQTTIYKYLYDSFNAEYDPENQNEVIGHIGVYHIYIKCDKPKPTELLLKKISKHLESLACIAYTSVNIKMKSSNIEKINMIMSQNLPPIEGDRSRQIGLKFIRYGEKVCYKNILISYGSCNKIDNTDVIVVDSEQHLLLEFAKCMRHYDPDFIIGYNIFNFDFPFLYHRAEELGVIDRFTDLGRILEKKSYMTEKRGKVKTLYLEISGRIQIDIYKILQREQPNLDSYKLDNVCSHFIKSKIKRMCKNQTGGTDIYVDDVSGIYSENYIHVMFVDGYTENKMEQKFKVISANRTDKDSIITISEDVSSGLERYKEKLWALAKDDLSPKELFKRFKGDADDRALIGKYCMMDVNLCIELLMKLQMITNNMGMANVCITPLNWIFMRGQGVKILSLISKTCRSEDYLLPTLLIGESDGQKYEGAFVLPPKPGVYLEDYITVLDYNSLYPSSMIAENLSHETYCGAMCRCDKHLDIVPITNVINNYFEEESLICDKCIELNKNTPMNDWLGMAGITAIRSKGLNFEDIPHDIFHLEFTKTGLIKSKTKIGVRICRFIQYPENKKGVLPRILMALLKARKDTRTKMTFESITLENGDEYCGIITEKDGHIVIKDENFKVIADDISATSIVDRHDKFSDFEIAVLDGLQLAYKVTANSLYGQLGARTSAVFLKDIAASTTATGRKQLLLAKDYVETKYHGAEVIYGDTDSIFVNFKPKDSDGNLLKGIDGLVRSIELGKDVSKGIKKILKNPQNLGYEKTFYPFCIFSKKRYVGKKYEEDPTKYKMASMGIVLKRRDNCPLVKIFFGGVIDILMNRCTYQAAVDYVHQCCMNLISDNYPIEKLTISKMLNSHYKNPDTIAHKVLADRIGERESGNKPQNGDRIPYVYIINPQAKLQADKIENPNFVLHNKLKLDHKFYITNQISKPIGQIFALFIEKLSSKYKEEDFDKQYRSLLSNGKTEYAAAKKVGETRLKCAIEYLFEKHVQELQRVENRLVHKQTTLFDFLGKK